MRRPVSAVRPRADSCPRAACRPLPPGVPFRFVGTRPRASGRGVGSALTAAWCAGRSRPPGAGRACGSPWMSSPHPVDPSPGRTSIEARRCGSARANAVAPHVWRCAGRRGRDRVRVDDPRGSEACAAFAPRGDGPVPMSPLARRRPRTRATARVRSPPGLDCGSISIASPRAVSRGRSGPRSVPAGAARLRRPAGTRSVDAMRKDARVRMNRGRTSGRMQP